MFSDHYRTVKIIALVIFLIILAAYAYRGRTELTFSQCLANPELCDGKEVPIYLEAQVVKVEPGRIRISQPSGPVDVWIPPDFRSIIPRGTHIGDLKPGQYLEARTVFHQKGYLELREIRIAPLRKLKIILSLFPLVLIMVLLLRSLRWEEGGLVIREK